MLLCPCKRSGKVVQSSLNFALSFHLPSKSGKYAGTGKISEKRNEQVSGAEEIICSATEMMRMEKANKRKLGVLADLPVYDIPYPQIKKIAALKNHI